MSTQANIVRVEVDLADPYRPLVNKITGRPIELPRSRDIQVEIGVRERGVWITDIETYIATVTVEVKATRTGSATVTVAEAGPFSNTTEGSWDDDTGQHATIVLPNGQTAGFTGFNSDGEIAYWLVITAATTGGKAITLAAGWVTAIEDGGNYSATTPAVGDASYVTTAMFFAALAALQQNVIEENGYRGRWGIDANGQPVWRQVQ